MSFKALSLFGAAAALVLGSVFLLADQNQTTPSSDTNETVSKPMTAKEKKKKEAKLRKELETPWKKWLNEDVVYIITDEERKAFRNLQTDEERQSFFQVLNNHEGRHLDEVRNKLGDRSRHPSLLWR